MPAGPDSDESAPEIGPREQRVIDNELAARRVNARIGELNRRALILADAYAAEEPAAFVCECADPDCGGRIAIGVDEYAKAHDQQDRFIIVPGHQVAWVERVVAQGEGYLVVEKCALPA